MSSIKAMVLFITFAPCLLLSQANAQKISIDAAQKAQDEVQKAKNVFITVLKYRDYKDNLQNVISLDPNIIEAIAQALKQDRVYGIFSDEAIRNSVKISPMIGLVKASEAAPNDPGLRRVQDAVIGDLELFKSEIRLFREISKSSRTYEAGKTDVLLYLGRHVFSDPSLGAVKVLELELEIAGKVLLGAKTEKEALEMIYEFYEAVAGPLNLRPSDFIKEYKELENKVIKKDTETELKFKIKGGKITSVAVSVTDPGTGLTRSISTNGEFSVFTEMIEGRLRLEMIQPGH